MSVGALPRPFGPFVLVQLLAEGGMGQVYLARVSSNAGIERICVVKTLKTRHARDDVAPTALVPVEGMRAGAMSEPLETLKPRPMSDKSRPRSSVQPVEAMSLSDKVGALNACGKRQACAGALLIRHRQGLAAKSIDKIREFRVEVDQCVAQCRR
jgi:hypothetical protein